MLTDSAPPPHFWMASLLCITDLMPTAPESPPLHRQRQQYVRSQWLPRHQGLHAVLPHLSLLLYIC